MLRRAGGCWHVDDCRARAIVLLVDKESEPHSLRLWSWLHITGNGQRRGGGLW